MAYKIKSKKLKVKDKGINVREFKDSGWLVVNEDNEWLSTGLTKEQAKEECKKDIKTKGGSCYAFEVKNQMQVKKED